MPEKQMDIPKRYIISKKSFFFGFITALLLELRHTLTFYYDYTAQSFENYANVAAYLGIPIASRASQG